MAGRLSSAQADGSRLSSGVGGQVFCFQRWSCRFVSACHRCIRAFWIQTVSRHAFCVLPMLNFVHVSCYSTLRRPRHLQTNYNMRSKAARPFHYTHCESTGGHQPDLHVGNRCFVHDVTLQGASRCECKRYLSPCLPQPCSCPRTGVFRGRHRLLEAERIRRRANREVQRDLEDTLCHLSPSQHAEVSSSVRALICRQGLRLAFSI
jgi:hypothetical protein